MPSAQTYDDVLLLERALRRTGGMTRVLASDVNNRSSATDHQPRTVGRGCLSTYEKRIAATASARRSARVQRSPSAHRTVSNNHRVAATANGLHSSRTLGPCDGPEDRLSATFTTAALEAIAAAEAAADELLAADSSRAQSPVKSTWAEAAYAPHPVPSRRTMRPPLAQRASSAAVAAPSTRAPFMGSARCAPPSPQFVAPSPRCSPKHRMPPHQSASLLHAAPLRERALSWQPPRDVARREEDRPVQCPDNAASLMGETCVDMHADGSQTSLGEASSRIGSEASRLPDASDASASAVAAGVSATSVGEPPSTVHLDEASSKALRNHSGCGSVAQPDNNCATIGRPEQALAACVESAPMEAVAASETAGVEGVALESSGTEMGSTTTADPENAIAPELVTSSAAPGGSNADLQRALRERDHVIAVLRGQVSARDQRILELEVRQAELIRPRAAPEIAGLEETIADLQRRLWVQRRLQTDSTGAVSFAQPVTPVECGKVADASGSMEECKRVAPREQRAPHSSEATQCHGEHPQQQFASKHEQGRADSPSCITEPTGSMALLGRLAAVKAQVKASNSFEAVAA